MENLIKIDTNVMEGSDKIRITEYGLEITNSLTSAEWCQAVKSVGKAHSMVQFYLGDLVVYAESPVTGWGEKYDELVELTGYEYGTLATYATVCRKYPVSVREEVFQSGLKNLTFKHFQIVTSLDLEVAKYLLQRAGEAGWSTRRLAEEVVKVKNGGVVPETFEEPLGYKSFKEVGKNVLKNFAPSRTNEEYDEVSWLLEMKEYIDNRLSELGIES